MTSPRKTNPTPAELEDAQAVADLMGGGTAHPTEDGGVILDPIADDRLPTEDELLADEAAAYIEHGERSAQNGWRIMADHSHLAPQGHSGCELAVPEGTPVLLPNAVLAWSTGQVLGTRFLVTLGTIFGPSTLVPSVLPCTEENLPIRYATALAQQLSTALGQIADNDEDDDLALRAVRLERQVLAISTELLS